MARDSEVNRPFKPQIYQSKRRGQSRHFYYPHNYERGSYQNRYRSNSGDSGIGFSRKGRGRPKYGKNYRREILEAMQDHIKILEDRIVESIGVITGMETTVETEVGIGVGKGHFQEIKIIIEEMIKA